MKFNSKEFEEFEKSEGPTPSDSVTQAIFERVNEDINPSPSKVFGKLSLIHFFVALLTLSICPQFGVRLLGDGMGLMTHFMRLGEQGCPIACGAFFMGTSVLIASLLLRPEEIQILRKNQILEFGALALLSLGAFVMFHAEIVVGFAIAWVLGTFLGSSLTFEMVRFVRRRMAQSW